MWHFKALTFSNTGCQVLKSQQEVVLAQYITATNP